MIDISTGLIGDFMIKNGGFNKKVPPFFYFEGS